jgi:phage-related protein
MEVFFEVKPHKRGNGQVPFYEAVANFKNTSGNLSDKVLAHVGKLDCKSKHSGLSIEKVDDKIWCLRVKQGSNCARVFFTYLKSSTIVLLSGFVKKSNKIPDNELEKARRLMKEVQYA